MFKLNLQFSPFCVSSWVGNKGNAKIFNAGTEMLAVALQSTRSSVAMEVQSGLLSGKKFDTRIEN